MHQFYSTQKEMYDEFIDIVKYTQFHNTVAYFLTYFSGLQKKTVNPTKTELNKTNKILPKYAKQDGYFHFISNQINNISV